jgi:hypothetical protein
MAFRDQVCAHLSEYRKDLLGIAEEGVFFHRGTPHRKGHILPAGHERQNLIAPYGDLFFASEHAATKLHQYFHHLNSSQGLCINLFYPLLRENALPLLIRSLGSDMSLPARGIFESTSRLENAERRTSFDFHLRNQEARDLFVEVKYTEEGFGGAKVDAEHLEKFRDTYVPLLENSKYLTKNCNDSAFFLQHYQLLRNLVHISPQSEVVFLFPRANAKVAEQAAHARETFLTERGRERMRIVFLEDLVTELIDACRGSGLAGYYDCFRRKYLDFGLKAF